MPDIKGPDLYQKLNNVGWTALEEAYNYCQEHDHPWVELPHWFLELGKEPQSDFQRILDHFEVNHDRLRSDLMRARDEPKRRGAGKPQFSSHLWDTVERGWVYATLLYGEFQIRTGHVLVSALKKDELSGVLHDASPEFEKIKLDQLTDRDAYRRMVSGSQEEMLAAVDGSFQSAKPAQPGEATAAAQPGALARFSFDLTERARTGQLDPVLGRDAEIRQVIDILMSRRQNNPILTGEAGVGKTAIVEGFALRIAAGHVPPPLANVIVRALDLGLLQAGASMKGEFEQRLKRVIEEVQQSPTPIILFIDEAHMLVGAGGAPGQGDAANLLKPALARGTLRTIAATTWGEYREFIEKDPALNRRFKLVKVEEPAEEKAIVMLRGLVPALEKHHQVRILEEGVRDVVRLSHRYIPVRQLPDKAVSLLDTACARVALSQHATPPALEDITQRIAVLQSERTMLEREAALGLVHDRRRPEILAEMEQLEQTRLELEQRWTSEKKIVTDLRAASDRVESNGNPGTPAGTTPGRTPEAAKATEEFQRRLKELQTLQGEAPLVLPFVDAQAVATVVSDWTGIPVRRMVRNEIQAVLCLADTLEKRVVGQKHALETITQHIQTSRAGNADPRKPVGVFLLGGPSGVGKTETALALAEALYGGEHNLITINMSEFQESHTVSTLKGAPPGYVGYGRGGVLTEAVRRRPHSIILLDEIEKAHPDVNEIFYQVFDKGRMEDAEGRLIDFKNTIILMTTNLGSELIMGLSQDPKTMPAPAALARTLKEHLIEEGRRARQSQQKLQEGRVFTPAFVGRMVVIPYYPLGAPVLRSIIELQLGRIRQRMAGQREQVRFLWDTSVVDWVAARCTSQDTGARMVDSILTHSLLPAISREVLTRLMDEKPVSEVQVTVQNDSLSYQFLDRSEETPPSAPTTTKKERN